MASYDDILKKLQEKTKNATFNNNSDNLLKNLNTTNDVINYAQNNGKSYDELKKEYNKSLLKNIGNAVKLKEIAKKNDIALSNVYDINVNDLRPTLVSIAKNDINKKVYEKPQIFNAPGTKIGTIVNKNQDELDRQTDAFQKKIANTQEYKDYLYRTNKLNPTLEYSMNVAKVNEKGINFADKALAPLLSGIDNIGNLSKNNSFLQDDNSRVKLPSINDIKTSKATNESDNGLYKAYADITQSVGNMVPGIAANAIVPGAGTLVFGANTFANAKNEALMEGHTEEQATTYGIINSTLELGVGKVLGGASSLLGKSPASKLLGENITSKIIKNPAINSAVSDMVSEFGEEYIQEWLDPKVKAFVLDNKNLIQSWESSKFFDKQNFYAGFLGALSAGLANTPNAVRQNININSEFENIVNTLQQDGNQKFTKEQVKQLKQTFYNEYNNAIKNNSEIDYDNITNQYENVVNNNNVIKEKINNNNYNFTGNASLDFSEQVEQWKKGKINQNEHLVLFKETPKLYQQMGLENHPITLVSNKLDRIYNETGKQNGEYHGLGELVKQLPDALEHPLNIVESATDPNSIVVITELSDKNNNIVIASIKMNGNGQIEIDNISKNILSNVLTSSYGKDNYDYSKKSYKGNYDGWMKKNADNGKILYDIDEGIKKQRINGQWLQLPNSINSFVENNIPQTSENVNNGISQYNMPNNKKNIPLDKSDDALKAENKKTLPKNPTKEYAYETKRTRKSVQEELQQEMGITTTDLDFGKDINALDFQRTDPIRLNEKVFGYEIGNKINDATIRKTKHNEAERTRFLNKEREEIKNLGIKARSKESAAVQKYGEKQYVTEHGEIKPYGDSELSADFFDVATQNKIKNAAKVLRNKYDEYIDKINEIITNMGYDAIPKRQDYMRHFQELNDKLSQWGIPLNRESLEQDSLPTDINGITEQFKPGKNWFASAMERKGLKTTYDAITGIDGYLEGASNLIYHTEDIQRYRALSKLVRETYGQTHGLDNVDLNTKEGQKRLNDVFSNKLSKYAAWLDEQANALAGKKGGIDRAAERLLGRKIYSILDTAKKQVGSNMTGFNVRSALTNFASAVQGASKTKKTAFLKGTISTINNILHRDNLIDKSDFLTSRFGSDQLSKKLWQKASNAGQILMTGSDYFTANQIWRSKYYENLSKGMNEIQAIKNADDFASRVMGDRSKGSTAEIFNSKTAGLLTQFQLEVNNQWSSIIHDNKMDIKSGNKSGATVIFQLGQLAAMSFMFNNIMKALTGSDVMIDPIDMLKGLIGGDDDEDKTLEERAQETIGKLWNNLPFASFLSGGRIPIGEAFNGAETLLKYATGQKDNYGNDININDVKKDLIESAYYWLLPTGYGQLKKTSKGLSMYNKNLPVAGSYTDSGNLRFNADTSTGGVIKATLFGQYSSEEAQKYIDSGYKTISASRIQEMKDLDMDASEYRKYRKNLNDSGTSNADKIEYIANSNYSDKQKNIMASNVLNKDFDIKEYNKYNSYEEYDYAQKNPEKYAVAKQIASYDKYSQYKEKIKSIQDNTTNDKEETIKYINSLNLNIPQKAMFIKQYYKNFKQYDKEIIEYINSKKINITDKETILKQLGFTMRNGRVYS